MKKLLLMFYLMAISLTCNASSIFSIWYIGSDSATQGTTYSIYIKAYTNQPTDTGRIYFDQPGSSYQPIQVFNINLNDISTLPLESDGTSKITFTIPSNIVGNCRFYSNGSPVVRYNIFIRSSIPDLKPVSLGAFSGNSGYSSFIKFKWTYSAIIGDTIIASLDGVVFFKKSLIDIETDSTFNFTINGISGLHRLTINYMNGYYDYAVNPLATAIIEPFNPSEPTQAINYFDILGRLVAPKDGDMIRYTSFGAIVY